MYYIHIYNIHNMSTHIHAGGWGALAGTCRGEACRCADSPVAPRPHAHVLVVHVSLSLYIYIYMYTHMIFIYIYIYIIHIHT